MVEYAKELRYRAARMYVCNKVLQKVSEEELDDIVKTLGKCIDTVLVAQKKIKSCENRLDEMQRG